VVNNPLLAGKTVFKMGNDKRQRIVLRFESRKKRAVRRFLETDKLHQVYPLAIDFLPDLSQPQDIRIAKIGFNGTGRVNRLSYVTENKYPYFRQFRQPALCQAT